MKKILFLFLFSFTVLGIGPQQAFLTAGTATWNPNNWGDTSIWSYAPSIALSDGASVSAFTNAAIAGGDNWAQATGGNQPTYESDGSSTINGLSVLRFNGTSGCMDGGTGEQYGFTSASEDRAGYIGMVVRVNATTNQRTFISKDAASAVTPKREWWAGILGADNNLRFFFSSLEGVGNNFMGRNYDAFSSTGVMLIEFFYSGNDAPSGVDMAVNGSIVDNSDFVSGVYTEMTHTTTPVRLGCSTNEGAYFRFGSYDLGEVVMRPSTVAGADLTQIRTFFDTRWNLPY